MITINHKDYIGKKLKELVEVTPKFAIGYYLVCVKGDRTKHLSEVVKNEAILSKTISDISDLHSDYSYYVTLE